jgi:hypothetical protein
MSVKIYGAKFDAKVYVYVSSDDTLNISATWVMISRRVASTQWPTTSIKDRISSSKADEAWNFFYKELNRKKGNIWTVCVSERVEGFFFFVYRWEHTHKCTMAFWQRRSSLCTSICPGQKEAINTYPRSLVMHQRNSLSSVLSLSLSLSG